MKRALLVASLAALPLGLVACSEQSGSSPDPRDVATLGWHQLPDLPLSKRFGPVAADVDGSVVVVGGDTGPQCPASASCLSAPAAARDGAVLDPRTEQWSAIAPAPVDLPAFTQHATVGSHLFVLRDRTLLDYDAEADQWRTLRTVSPWYELVSAGDRLVLVLSSDEDASTKNLPDLVYTVATQRWTALPADPLGDLFERTVTDTGRGLVLSGHPLSASPQPTDPLYAALYDDKARTWKRLGNGTQSQRIDWDAAGWIEAHRPRLPHADEWSVEGYPDRSQSENLKRPKGAPERIGSVAWVDGTVYVIGGARSGGIRTSDYDRRVWRISPHAALQ